MYRPFHHKNHQIKHPHRRQAHGWTLHDFAKFYRVDDCRKAMALARVRDGDRRTEEDLKRADLVEEGNKVK